MQFSKLPDAPKSVPFLGKGWAFPPEFNISDGSTGMVSDEEDIWQSLQILFSTSIGERVLQPEYGCNLDEFLFAPINASFLSYLEELMRRAITMHEPRIILDNLRTTTDEKEGKISIHLTYTVRTTNTRYNRVYPFYFQEGTNVEQ